MVEGDWKNKLYFGDNLDVMGKYIAPESIDLIYLDPPFNSQADYNVLFKEKNGTQSVSQINAFTDTWKWSWEVGEVYDKLVEEGPKALSDLIKAMKSFLGTNDMTAYLVMMAVRLVEMHKLLKSTGSIYLHCDPTASHYIKVLMDSIFSVKNYRNEIVWCYKTRPQSRRHFGKKHDTVLFYSKTDDYKFNWMNVLRPLSEETIKKYRLVDDEGRRYRLQGRGITGSPIRSAKDVNPEWERTNPELVVRDYLEDKKGVMQEDWWADINIINQAAKERIGYPTQKPEALLERIIRASSNEGGLILDPFCGCGTTVAVAERLGRRWIGIDITYLAINLMIKRLNDSFERDLSPYEVYGEPADLKGAHALAEHDRHQFELWAINLVGARSARDERKGADSGVDGYRYFKDGAEEHQKIIVQVKSGNVKRGDIATLKGDVEREEAVIGVFITLNKPTQPMIKEAALAGSYTTEIYGVTKSYPRVQILTIEELLNGKKLLYPDLGYEATFKKAKYRQKGEGKQTSMDDLL